MRPTDFCTPKQSNSSTLASPLPSVAILIPRPEPFGARAWGPHSYRALRLVPVHAKRPLFALPLRESGDSRSRHRAARATRCERGWGESRFTTRSSLRRPCERHAGAFSSPVRDRYDRLWHPCRLLRARWRGPALGEFHAVARRPPRPVPRGPCDRRALSRSEVPSAAGRPMQPARTEMRTNPQCLPRRRGAHVMRIAELRGLTLFHQEEDSALARSVHPCG